MKEFYNQLRNEKFKTTDSFVPGFLLPSAFVISFTKGNQNKKRI